MLDVFNLRGRDIGEYAAFSRSFARIAAPDIAAVIEAEYARERYWTEPLKRLEDHVVRRDLRTEELARHFGDRLVLVFNRVLRGHRRRRADAQQALGQQSLLEAAHEHRHVGAPPAAIGVQFVEHERLETAAVLDDEPIVRFVAREDQQPAPPVRGAIE